MNSKLFTTLLIALFIFGSLATENFDLEVGQSSTGAATKTDKFRAVRIIKVGDIKNKYLFAVVSHKEDTRYEPIKMAIFHNEETTPMVVCQTTNTDACFVAGKQLTKGDKLVVAIQCEDECKFSFQSYWSGVESLIPNTFKKTIFDDKNKAQIYHMDLTNETFKEVRIVLVPETRRMPGDNVKIYGNYGFDKDPTVEQHDFESQNLWKDGQGIFLNADEIKNKKLSFLVVGSTGTIYEINPEIVRQEHKQIMTREPVYEYIKEKSFKKYRVSFSQDTADEYEIHLAKFSGDVQFTFFKDSLLTQEYKIRHFEYMNDIKYLLLAGDLKKDKITDLYIKAETESTNAIFATMFTDQTFNGASIIFENIYDFLPIHEKRIVYLHFENFVGQKFDNREIDVNIIKVSGQSNAQFRICNGELEKCMDLKAYETSSKRLQPIDDSIIGMKSSSKLRINNQDFLEMSEFQTSGVVLIVLENQNENKEEPALVSIDYTIGDDTQDLRQGHPIESIIDKNQVKYFKFVNSDLAVSGVKIHVTPIRGTVEIKGCYSDPRLDSSTQFDSIANQVIFTEKLDKALYVSVKGLEPSNIAVTVQLNHNEAQYSSISIEESVEYTFRIPPKGAQILKANPIFKSLKFNYRASNQVHVCMLDEDEKCDEQGRPVVSKNGQIALAEHKDSTNQIVIGNPSQTNFVQVKVIYHSQDYQHCEQRTMEELYTESVSAGDCFNFPIHQPLEDVLFAIDRHDIGPLVVKAYACFQEIQITSSTKILILAEQISQLCKNQNQGGQSIAIVFLGDQSKPKEVMKVQISGLYPQSIVNLADGVAFNVHGKGKEGKVGTYYYHAVNLIDTFVALKSLRGNFKFFLKIIDAKQRTTAQVNQIEYDFKSESFNFFTNPFVTIKNEDYMKSSCNECGLLVSVYSSDVVGGDIEYSIEAFQNEIIVKDHVSYQTHLSKESFVCYEYESLKPKGECNLIVEISDNNRDCAAVYLSNREYPSDQNFLVKEIGSKLTYSECEIGTYYVTVVAIEDCPYSISISNTKYAIARAERGVPVSISLQENQVKYVLFRHISKTGFKLVTLEKFGSVELYANQLDPQHLEELRDSKDLSYETFTFKSSYTDTLYIDPTDKGYCSDCYYIVAIKALRETESSLVLADEEVPIQISHKKILNDEILKKGDKTYLEFKNILAGRLPFQVHSGAIKVTITYKDQRVDHTFEKKKQLQIYNFELDNPEQVYDWSPIKVNIQCQEPVCIYSVGLIDNTDSLIPPNQTTLVPGTPSYLFMSEGAEHCIVGFIRDFDDDIIITVDYANIKALSKFDMNLKINGQATTEFVKNSVRNIMTITVNSAALNLTGTNAYHLCLRLPEQQEILVIVDQGEQINLLPEDSEVLVQEQNTFIVYPEGPFLVDIFECSGATTFKHGFSEEELETEMSQLSTIAMPDQPHAVKLSSFLPTFLKIKSALSIIRWLPIDEIAQRGLGYFKYRVGDLKYETSADDIKILWGSVSKFKQTNTTVSKIGYKLFISDNSQNLKSASSCEKFLPEDVIVIDLNFDQSQVLDNNLAYSISKNQIGKKFKGRTSDIYMILVADMTLQPPQAETGQPEEQYYRFMYHVQQIPKDVFAGYEGSPFEQPVVLIGIGIGAFLAIVAILYIVLKKMIPIISRMKNNMMLEEDAQAKKEDGRVDPVIQSNERIVVDDS